MAKVLSNQEPKGTRDWLPEEFAKRQYIFSVWRRVCQRYGFQEYLTPLVEHAEIYRAKSGEDVGGQELVTFTDWGGRELCIRPEMTPSVTRMVSKIYAASPKPLKLFSIANFMRNEKPQRGRNREFWQLNCDIFGSGSLAADQEILQLALDIMLEFDPPQDSFVLSLSHRQLIAGVLDLAGAESLDQAGRQAVVRTLDKWAKLSRAEIAIRLTAAGLTPAAQEIIFQFMASTSLADVREHLPDLAQNEGWLQLREIIARLEEAGYGDLVEFQPAVIRGFDYYDGVVFELFDKHPDNRRALFGGGRYNGLARLFGSSDFPAVGFAPGDETLRIFLESWDLLDKARWQTAANYYLPLLDVSLASATSRLARELRGQGLNVLTGLEEQKLARALEFADRQGLDFVIIYGSKENERGVYRLKDMTSGQEQEKAL